MAETFQLPVDYEGREDEYPAQILTYGYVQKVQVTIDGTVVTFEPDEEGSYRALIDPLFSSSVDTGLLQTISETLKVLFE
jgi:hypothetical protein